MEIEVHEFGFKPTANNNELVQSTKKTIKINAWSWFYGSDILRETQHYELSSHVIFRECIC